MLIVVQGGGSQLGWFALGYLAAFGAVFEGHGWMGRCCRHLVGRRGTGCTAKRLSVHRTVFLPFPPPTSKQGILLSKPTWCWRSRNSNPGPKSLLGVWIHGLSLCSRFSYINHSHNVLFMISTFDFFKMNKGLKDTLYDLWVKL